MERSFINVTESFMATPITRRGMAGVVLAAACLPLTTLVSGCSSNQTPENVVDKYMRYCFDQSANAQIGFELIEPNMMEAVLGISGASRDEAEKQFEDYRSDMFSKLDDALGSGWKYSYQIGEEVPYDDSDMFETKFFCYNNGLTSDEDIAEGMKADVTISVEGTSGASDSKEEIVRLIKVGDEWYIDPSYFTFRIDW